MPQSPSAESFMMTHMRRAITRAIVSAENDVHQFCYGVLQYPTNKAEQQQRLT
jgi:hypothetical protein